MIAMVEDLYDEIRNQADDIRALNTSEAKLRAQALLQDKRRFNCEPNQKPNLEVLAGLSPLQRELFSLYGVIEVATGESFLSIYDIRPSEAPGLQYLGGEEAGNYAIRPGDEAIYLVYSPQPGGPPRVERNYPTIYHWVLLTDLFFTTE